MNEKLENVKLEYAEFCERLNKELEKAVDEELYKDCKCNNCVWAYKEARFCPLGRCIQGNK